MGMFGDYVLTGWCAHCKHKKRLVNCLNCHIHGQTETLVCADCRSLHTQKAHLETAFEAFGNTINELKSEILNVFKPILLPIIVRLESLLKRRHRN